LLTECSPHGPQAYRWSSREGMLQVIWSEGGMAGAGTPCRMPWRYLDLPVVFPDPRCIIRATRWGASEVSCLDSSHRSWVASKVYDMPFPTQKPTTLIKPTNTENVLFTGSSKRIDPENCGISLSSCPLFPFSRRPSPCGASGVHISRQRML